MGSRATADRRVMESVLAALPDGMYFIDSKTTGSSVAAAVAREPAGNVDQVAADRCVAGAGVERRREDAGGAGQQVGDGGQGQPGGVGGEFP